MIMGSVSKHKTILQNTTDSELLGKFSCFDVFGKFNLKIKKSNDQY